jgi:hypothetical protein
MPIKLNLKPEFNLGVLVHIGIITDDEFLAFYKSLYESGQLDPSMNLLVDLRQSESAPRSSEVLRQFAGFVQKKFTKITTRPKVAVVAPEDLSFGLARMYEVFAHSIPWDFEVFRAVDAALSWLALPGDLMDNPGDNARSKTKKIK